MNQEPRKRAYVLLSGGIDSTTCLYIARRQFEEVVGVSVNYGQRHLKEVDYAYDTCRNEGVQYVVLDAQKLIPRTMLTDDTIELPKKSYEDIEGVSPTYVPFRNGTLLSLITAYAQGWLHDSEITGEDMVGIYFGAHAEDAHNWAYPDCTPEFIGAMANAIYIGTYRQARLYTPLMSMQKYQIIRRGDKLGVDWVNTWSCYAGGDLHCGECPTCISRRESFKTASVLDPTEYAV